MTGTATPATPSAVDAVAGALGVQISDADRAAYQVPAAPEPTDPPTPAPEPTDPPAPAPAAATPPAAKPTDPPADDKPAELTPEAIAAALDGPPAPNPEDGKTGVAELDEEIPADVQGRTRQRIEALVTRGRETHAQIQQLTAEREQLVPLAQQAEGWQRIVVQSGLAPQDFASVMGTMAAINGGTVEQKRVALGKLRELYERVATDVGEVAPGQDPQAQLAAYPDLAAKVNNLEIPLSDALELAAARRARAAAEADAARRTQAQTQEQAFAQARTQAEGELNALGAALAQRDGDAFLVRRHIAMRAVQNQVASLHPSQWRQAFLDAYNATPQAVVDGALAQIRGGNRQAPAAPRRNTPVMQAGGGGGTGGPGGNGGTPNREIKTTQDAVFAALGLPAPV